MNCCNCEECFFDIKTYTGNNKFKKNRSKAGVVVTDRSNSFIILVQSRGNLWGFPKGSIEKDEETIDAAVREVFEETGILLSKSKLNTMHKINSHVTYYQTEIDKVNIKVQDTLGNDVNAIGWVNIKCLQILINKNKIRLNSHAKILCRKIFNITIPKMI